MYLTTEARKTSHTVSVNPDEYHLFGNKGDKSTSTGNDSSALFLSLQARDKTSLDQQQVNAIRESSAKIDAILKSNFETIEQIETQFSDHFEFEVVEDLSTTDGQQLRGVTTESGRILIDDDLAGRELLEVLAEEVAEAAYYEAFGSASDGDFGAEVVYRRSGGSDLDHLQQLRNAAQDDTVQTAWGKGQASQNSLDGFVSESDLGREYAYAPIKYFYSDTGSLRPTQPNNDPGSLSPQFSEATLREYDSDIDLNTFIKTASGYDTSLVDFSGLNNGTSPNSLGTGSQRFDMNGDGKADQFSYVGSLTHESFHGSKSPITVDHISGADLTATDNSSRVYVGQGSVKSTWTVSNTESHSTSEDFNYNENIATAVKTNVNFGVFSAGTDITVSGSSGNQTSNGSTFGVTKTVQHWYSIDAGDYEPGTLVSYGFHMLTADIRFTEEFVAVLEITNADEPTYLFVDVAVNDTLEDHSLGLVLTDYSISDQPDFDDLITTNLPSDTSLDMM